LDDFLDLIRTSDLARVLVPGELLVAITADRMPEGAVRVGLRAALGTAEGVPTRARINQAPRPARGAGGDRDDADLWSAVLSVLAHDPADRAAAVAAVAPVVRARLLVKLPGRTLRQLYLEAAEDQS